jgi:hypothetical protein
MSAAELIARSGSALEIVSPERVFAPEVGGMNLVPYMRAFTEAGVRITPGQRLTALRREGNGLVAVLGSDYAPGWSDERRVDQVVVDHATAPLDDLYLALRPLSRNRGAVDHAALVGGGAVFPQPGPAGGFLLYRIGDAVAARNIHAAVYDALRLGLRW